MQHTGLLLTLVLFSGLSWLGGPPARASDAVDAIPIAIIIDDLGYDPVDGRAATALPGALTLAVLPHSPHGATIAELAHESGKEVMLHVPMSNLQNRPLDEGALTVEMDRLAFLATLAEGLHSIPHVKGLNNHMGSRLTQEVTPMQWLMAELKARRLYFVDSRTSAATRALETAQRYRLPSVKRDVFLDNELDPAQIELQFQRLLRKARRQGYAVAIGHPHPQTLRFLDRALRDLSTTDFRLVSISRLLSSLPPPGRKAPISRQRPLDGPWHSIERLNHNHFE